MTTITTVMMMMMAPAAAASATNAYENSVLRRDLYTNGRRPRLRNNPVGLNNIDGRLEKNDIMFSGADVLDCRFPQLAKKLIKAVIKGSTADQTSSRYSFVPRDSRLFPSTRCTDVRPNHAASCIVRLMSSRHSLRAANRIQVVPLTLISAD